MSKRFEVHIRGRRTITTATREEADDWAAVLGTTTAPATVLDTTPQHPALPDTEQLTIFEALETP